MLLIDDPSAESRHEPDRASAVRAVVRRLEVDGHEVVHMFRSMLMTPRGRRAFSHARRFLPRPYAECSARSAVSPCLRSTTQEMRRSEATIMWMLILCSARVSNILAATPW